MTAKQYFKSRGYLGISLLPDDQDEYQCDCCGEVKGDCYESVEVAFSVPHAPDCVDFTALTMCQDCVDNVETNEEDCHE